tara:strand:+ start:817 stop:1128 length:312 start_codon:yes stop_codon:yes gene_type:complete
MALTLAFVFSTFSMAGISSKKSLKSAKSKKVAYTKASASKLKLSASDLAIIDKAIDNDFSKLSRSEIATLKKFLEDFKSNTAQDKSVASQGGNKKSKTGRSSK